MGALTHALCLPKLPLLTQPGEQGVPPVQTAHGQKLQQEKRKMKIQGKKAQLARVCADQENGKECKKEIRQGAREMEPNVRAIGKRGVLYDEFDTHTADAKPQNTPPLQACRKEMPRLMADEAEKHHQKHAHTVEQPQKRNAHKARGVHIQKKAAPPSHTKTSEGSPIRRTARTFSDSKSTSVARRLKHKNDPASRSLPQNPENRRQRASAITQKKIRFRIVLPPEASYDTCAQNIPRALDNPGEDVYN